MNKYFGEPLFGWLIFWERSNLLWIANTHNSGINALEGVQLTSWVARKWVRGIINLQGDAYQAYRAYQTFIKRIKPSLKGQIWPHFCHARLETKKFELNHDKTDHYQLCNHFMIVLMQEWILKLELNHNCWLHPDWDIINNHGPKS